MKKVEDYLNSFKMFKNKVQVTTFNQYEQARNFYESNDAIVFVKF